VKKILLTGATGFIGSELLKNLSNYNKVYITLRKRHKINPNNKNIIKIHFNSYKDLSHKFRKIKVDTVIHCATHYVKSHKFEDIKKLSESNILFGNIILENLKIMRVKKFVNFSTVWENFDGKKDNFYNLYSAYKASFIKIISFYKKKNLNIKFLNLVISDTFGLRDKRKKIVNLLKTNYKRNLVTKIVSKNLHINLLNVKDIVNAIELILKKNYKSDNYILKNKNNFKIYDIVKEIEKYSQKKLRVKWLSNKIIKEKTYQFETLKGWKPKNSNIKDIVRVITE
tara:strand:+ start:4230 stop:5081 length:852 start_codon:yes stop_codon:yes gene_type:complete